MNLEVAFATDSHCLVRGDSAFVLAGVAVVSVVCAALLVPLVPEEVVLVAGVGWPPLTGVGLPVAGEGLDTVPPTAG